MLHMLRALRAGPSLFEVYRNRPHTRANTLKWEQGALPALKEKPCRSVTRCKGLTAVNAAINETRSALI
jgi:hypothetical protein